MSTASDVAAKRRGSIEVKHTSTVEIAVNAADLEHAVLGRRALSPGIAC